LTIFVFNFSKTNGAWYPKRALKVKVAFSQGFVCGKNVRPLTWSVPEIFSKHKKTMLTLKPSSGRTGKLSRVRSTSRESTIH